MKDHDLRAKVMHGQEIIDMIHQLQPNCLVNNRLAQTFDYNTPEQKIPAGKSNDPFEVCMTLNKHWGYYAGDEEWKSTTTVVRTFVDIASKGGNFLLNVGPTGEGIIPAGSAARLHEVGAWLKTNGEAIYGTAASPLGQLAWGRCTKKISADGTTLYLHVFDWPADGKLVVPGVRDPVISATLLATRGALATSVNDSGITIAVPARAPDPLSTTIALKLKTPRAAR